jgi:hypothetical protein
MSAPAAFLKCRLHLILPEVEAELEEIREGIPIVLASLVSIEQLRPGGRNQ